MFTKGLRTGRRLPVMLVLAICLIFPLVFGSTTSSGLVALADEPAIQGEPVTGLQTELAAAFTQRQAMGLPVPTVTFSAKSDGVQGFGAQSPTQVLAMAGKTTTITATTIIYFDGPKEAGYAEWPALEISGDLASAGTAPFSTGDLTEIIRKGIAEQNPEFWQQVEFGQEARRYTIIETLVQSAPSESLLAGMSSPGAIQGTSSADVLMGFTYTGPHIDETREYTAELCIPIPWFPDPCYEAFYIKAGVELDWALGLRLPASVTMTGPDLVEQGNSYNFQTSLTPQDWDASKYAGYGVAAENGNEFVLTFKFFAGVKMRIGGFETCPLPPGVPCYVEIPQLDKSTSFTTPFGAGSSFPIPPIVIPLYSIGDSDFLSFTASLTITPQLTSTEIKADWHTVPGNDCYGSGTVTYTAPGEPVDFGPVSICNLDNTPTTNQAQVELENFRYYFNVFTLTMGAQVEVHVLNLYDNTFGINFYTLDLSKFFSSLGLAVGDHVQCDYKFICGRTLPTNTLLLMTTTQDLTPPITTILLPPFDGTNNWYVSNVQVYFTAADTCGSGVDKTEYSLDNVTWTTYAGSVMLTDEGEFTVYYRSTDKEGNVESSKSQTFKIDKTPPVITGAPTVPPNAFGWWNTDVVVHFDATDAVSGIDYVTPDVVISTEGENQSVIGTATDMAGNSAQVTVSEINIDKTPPVVTITNPLPQTYANTGSFNIQWTALDSLSGINTEAGDMDDMPVSNGQLVELLLVAAGEHAVTVLAVDKADNPTTVSVGFFVQVDIDGLLASVEYMCQQGWINQAGICKSLLAELKSAKLAMERGQCEVAQEILHAFINEVEALSGKWLTEQAAIVLKANALYVIENPTCSIASP